MILSLRAHTPIALVALVVAALAAANGYVFPDRLLAPITAVGAMAAIWLVVIWVERVKSGQTDSQRRMLVRSACIAGLMLVVALGAKLAHVLGLDGGMLSHRAPGVIMGFMLMAVGNMAPKAVGPLTAKRCSPAQTQSLQRSIGWTFVLAGLAFAGVWMLAPLDQANAIATTICAGALILVIGRWTWTLARPGAPSRP